MAMVLGLDLLKYHYFKGVYFRVNDRNSVY